MKKDNILLNAIVSVLEIYVGKEEFKEAAALINDPKKTHDLQLTITHDGKGNSKAEFAFTDVTKPKKNSAPSINIKGVSVKKVKPTAAKKVKPKEKKSK